MSLSLLSIILVGLGGYILSVEIIPKGLFQRIQKKVENIPEEKHDRFTFDYLLDGNGNRKAGIIYYIVWVLVLFVVPVFMTLNKDYFNLPIDHTKFGEFYSSSLKIFGPIVRIDLYSKETVAL